MLEMVCVVEDLKVSTDDLFEDILVWEDEVQSVDMVSMQKIWEGFVTFMMNFHCYEWLTVLPWWINIIYLIMISFLWPNLIDSNSGGNRTQNSNKSRTQEFGINKMKSNLFN